MVKRDRSFIVISILVLGLVLLDQISKYLIRAYIPINTSIEIAARLLYFTHVTNTGISFGLFKGNNLFFMAVAIAVLAFLIYSHRDFLKHKIPYSFIIAGILGNLIDRIFLGSVVDFIDLRFWPIFNVADSCISIGVVTLIFLMLRDEKRGQASSSSKDSKRKSRKE